MTKYLLDLREFCLDSSPAEQIHLIDLEAQHPVQHLEPAEKPLGVPHRTEDAREQDGDQLVQALPMLFGLVHQLGETPADEPPDLPRQRRWKRHLVLDQSFERGAAAVAVILAERPDDPLRIISEEV